MDTPKYDVFLSYNRADKNEVELIAQYLRQEAKLNPFLDRWHLVPGEPWQGGIEEALEQSETMAVFFGSSGISPWHNEAMRAGLDRAVSSRDDVRLIPVLLPGADPTTLPSFVTHRTGPDFRTGVDFRSGLDDATAFARLVAGILGQPTEQAGAFTLPDEPAPYPGLLAFTNQQADLFFGRSNECQKLSARVSRSPFVAIVGASGSGKSSLVLAGLLPQLEQGWQALAMVPGGRPLRTLAEKLSTLVQPVSPGDHLHLVDQLTARLAEQADGLSTALSTFLTNQPDVSTLLIVVDQFEELFTQVSGEPTEVHRQQQQFIANLVDVVHTFDGRVRLVLTLRADFVRHCLDFTKLRPLLETNQLLLGPMGEDALREAIVKPAQAVGAMFEKGLVARLMAEMRDQPAALPLMQFAMAQLWQRRQGPWLTHAAYEAIGGISGAIDQRADTIYEQLSEPEKTLARSLFLRLVTLGEGASDTRRRVQRNELDLMDTAPEQMERLISLLAQPKVRLIATDADSVELAHESLIEQWGQLRRWLEENRAALRIHRQLTKAAGEWQHHKQDVSYLHRGLKLSEAQTWAEAHPDQLSKQEHAFLTASLVEQQREEQERQKQARRKLQIRRQRRLAVGLSLGLLIIAALAAFAFFQRSEALRARQEADRLRIEAQNQADSRRLAAASADQLTTNHELALLLAVEGGRAAGTLESDTALRRALAHRGRTVSILSGHTGPLIDAVWNEAGTRIATAGDDGTAQVWDVNSGTQVAVFAKHAARLRHITWNKAGTHLVTVSDDGTARVWEAETGDQTTVFDRHIGGVRHAAWNEVGTHIITGGDDGTIRIWDAATGAEIDLLNSHENSVVYVAWSPDGRRIASASYDGTAQMWDITGGTEPVFLAKHAGRVVYVTWRSNSSQFVTTSYDGTARVWDADRGTDLVALNKHTAAVWHAAWNKAGTQIVTASDDGTARIWNARNGVEVTILRGHTGGINYVAWNKAGTQIITASQDGTVRVWDAKSGAETMLLTGHSGAVLQANLNDTGTHLVTAGADGTARVWDMASGDAQTVLLGHKEEVRFAMWNKRGTRLATASFDGTARVWDAETGDPLAVLVGHTDKVRYIAWDNTEMRLATAGFDGSARVWDAETGDQLALLAGHTDAIWSVAWSSDDTHLITASADGTAGMWDVQSKTKLATLSGHTRAVVAATWNSDDTRLVTTSEDGTARIWDIESGKTIAVLGDHEQGVLYATWSPDDTRLVTTSFDDTARIWNIENRTEPIILSGHTRAVVYAAWDSTGARLVTSSFDGTARIWDAETGDQLALLIGHIGHTDRVWSAVWNSDNTRIVTASGDGMARIWDAETGNELAILSGHTDPVLYAAWNTDGTRIATASFDTTTRIHYTSIEDLLEVACERTPRNMTQEEWGRYMGDEMYRETCPK